MPRSVPLQPLVWVMRVSFQYGRRIELGSVQLAQERNLLLHELAQPQQESLYLTVGPRMGRNLVDDLQHRHRQRVTSRLVRREGVGFIGACVDRCQSAGEQLRVSEGVAHT